jgi:hypothetical protein
MNEGGRALHAIDADAFRARIFGGAANLFGEFHVLFVVITRNE